MCILNEFTLQTELRDFVTNNVYGQKQQRNNKTNIKHKNSYRSRESNSGPVAPQSDALPLDHCIRAGTIRSLYVQYRYINQPIHIDTVIMLYRYIWKYNFTLSFYTVKQKDSSMLSLILIMLNLILRE